jgi:hypothetical protein
MRRRGQLHKICGQLDEYERFVCRLRRHDKYERRRGYQRNFLHFGKQFQFGKQCDGWQLDWRHGERRQLDWRNLYERSSRGSCADSNCGDSSTDHLSRGGRGCGFAHSSLRHCQRRSADHHHAGVRG